MDYHVKDREIIFAIESLWNDALSNGFDKDQLAEKLGIDLDTMVAVVNESAKYCETELAPLNRVGDNQGATLQNGEVVMPQGWQQAYDGYAQAGWCGLTAPTTYGGQALPQLLSTSVIEMTHAANMAFGLLPMLTQGVIETLADFGNEFQNEHYLKPLIKGEFSGTMNLTEPQAGSDLRLIKTKAVRTEENHDGEAIYRLSGQKIFITYGEHSLTKNIVHLVLAKIEGSDDISLFLVPKFTLDGKRNDIQCLKLEEKMGIHASPTCVMSYGENDGAVGFLIGDADKGLSYMFKMMNVARHAVGVEGLSQSSRSFQASLAYAKDRKQGRGNDGDDAVSIIHHADVQRMLLIMESSIYAMRALCYGHAWHMDKLALIQSEEDVDVESQKAQTQMIELFTPIVKGWCTELSNEVTSLGIQIHGGMGYIEETGVAQYYRDTRITSIYEGTTGIQANDLIYRKVIRDEGIAMQAVIDDMLEFVDSLEKAAADNEGSLFVIWRKFRDAVDELEHATEWLLENKKNTGVVSAIAYDYLMLCGYVFAAWQLNKQALFAHQQQGEGMSDGTIATKTLYLAEFFCAQMLPRAMSHEAIILRGAGCVKRMADKIYGISDKAKEED